MAEELRRLSSHMLAQILPLSIFCSVMGENMSRLDSFSSFAQIVSQRSQAHLDHLLFSMWSNSRKSVLIGYDGVLDEQLTFKGTRRRRRWLSETPAVHLLALLAECVLHTSNACRNRSY